MTLTPKQQKQLRRPRPFLFLLLMALFGLPWVLLFRNGVRSRHQQAEMTVLSEAFFAQFETYPRNDSAKQFDQLGASLGFIPNDSRDLTYQIDAEADRAYRAIEAPLGQFLEAQIALSADSLAPLPPSLASYLSTVRPQLNRLQAHLLNGDRPQWEVDIERMSDQVYPFPGLSNTLNVQKLLLLSAVDYHQHHQHSKMVAALEASWQLNQAVSLRPDLTSQVSASVVSAYQAGLLRRLDDVPLQWQARLAQQAEQQSVMRGLEFDVWLQYQTLQKSLAQVIIRSSRFEASASGEPIKNLAYWFSPVYYFNLTNIDTAQTAQRALDRLNALSVCATSQAEAEAMLATEETARWNEAIAPVPSVLARRWRVAGDRAIALELTQKVLEAKQQAPATGQWPKSLANTTSTICPQERWIYKLADDNTITISLSTAVVPAPLVPISYQSKAPEN
ncbi:MAG: hypothetical protein WBA76_08675 [Phormidesmis sp.]